MPIKFRLCNLRGYRRCWNVAMDNSQDLAAYKYYLDADTGHRPEVYVTFLNIRPAAGHEISGILFSVTEEELLMLDTRERNYTRNEISSSVDMPTDGKVWVYQGSEEARERYVCGLSKKKAVIQKAYYHYVYNCFLQLGQSHAEAYLNSTDAPEVPLRELKRVNL